VQEDIKNGIDEYKQVLEANKLLSTTDIQGISEDEQLRLQYTIDTWYSERCKVLYGRIFTWIDDIRLLSDAMPSDIAKDNEHILERLSTTLHQQDLRPQLLPKLLHMVRSDTSRLNELHGRNPASPFHGPTSAAHPLIQEQPKRKPGRPVTIPIERKERAFAAKQKRATNREVAMILYDSQRPTRKQIDSVHAILNNYLKTRSVPPQSVSAE
jgi:hypothetical protein